MNLIARTLLDPATYRRLVWLLTALVLGPIWFTALITVWSLCLGLAITPLVIPVLIVLASMTRAFAAVEAWLARSLLDVDGAAPAAVPSRPGFWGWLRAQFRPGFWRAQAYLLMRWIVGFPVAVAVLTALAVALGTLAAPVWVPFLQHGVKLGFWRPHTFVQSLAGIPVGLVLLPLSVLISRSLAAPLAPIASALLKADPTTVADRSEASAGRGWAPGSSRGLEIHAAVDAVLAFVPVAVWVVTSPGYFWPIWVVLPLATVLAIHAWLVVIADEPSIVSHFRGSRSLATTTGIGVIVAALLTTIWGVTAHGYFWPVWPMLAIAVVLGTQLLAVLLLSPRRAELTERIETLETTRAGAVDAQETELRRIERDLHDGAQARLAGLGMTLGLAAELVDRDPERARQMLTEARQTSSAALGDLRDVVHGIHPPVLADRGLKSAIAALAIDLPVPVEVSGAAPDGLPPPVESATYFTVAECLANVAKHASASRAWVELSRRPGLLEVVVGDDGRGGADPASGTGMRGVARRLAAFDGTMRVSSPAGGPTLVTLEVPCDSSSPRTTPSSGTG